MNLARTVWIAGGNKCHLVGGGCNVCADAFGDACGDKGDSGVFG